MNPPMRLTIDLLSETTFAGSGPTAGEVDIEIDHDELGLPRLSAKALHGLLRDSWLSMQEHFPELHDAAARVFGQSADLHETAILRIGDGSVDPSVLDVVRAATMREVSPLSPWDVLHALTAVRTQTAEERTTGAPATGTLRKSRVLIRGLQLTSALSWLRQPEAADLQVLALAILSTRHAGLARNRGRGFIRLLLDGDVASTRMAGGLE